MGYQIAAARLELTLLLLITLIFLIITFIAVPVTRSSGVLENITNKKKIQHEKIVNEMNEKIIDINMNVETQIRLESESIKQKFLNVKNDTEKIIERFNVQDQKVVSTKYI